MICLLASFVMGFISMTGYAQNMLNNPGFEEWADGKPVGWFGEKTQTASLTVTQYTANVHGGSSACQLVVSGTSHRRFTSASLSVEGGKTYTVKFWLRGSGEVRTGFWDGQGSDGTNFSYNLYINAGASWAQHEQTVTAPVTANNAELIFSVLNTSGDHIIIDDVEFIGDGAPPALVVDFEADQTVAALNTTIKFRDKSTGSPVQWTWSITGPQDFDSHEQHPSFTFTKAGTYDVKLIASNEETSGEKEEIGYIVIGDFIFYQNWNTQDDWKGWTKVNVSGTQEWRFTQRYGIDDSPCIQMSGHDGTSSVENEDWLISPEFSLVANNKVVLNFYNAYKHAGPTLRLFISNNYTGDVSSADWKELNFVKSSGDFNWENSGDISLSAYSGNKCYVAFQYISSNTESSSWELDDIMLKDEGGVAINEVEPLEFNVYPNPSTGMFYVDAKSDVNIKIYSISGRLIREFDVNGKTQIDMSADAKGIYFVQITNPNGAKAVKKVIVQ